MNNCLAGTLVPILLFPGTVGALPKIETVVVTASRTEQALSSISSSISVIEREDLELIGAVHINQVLKRIPGTWISRGNGQESLTAIRSPVFTGPGSCGNFYMAEDGIPLRGTGFCNVNQLFDANTEQAQRIEVLRGPGTSVLGANALHGVINIISQPPAPSPRGIIDVEVGPDDYRRALFSYSYLSAKHAGRLSINATHDGGYQDHSGFDQQKISYRNDYSGEIWQIQSLLSLSNLNQDTAGYITGEDAYKDSDRLVENDFPEAYRDNFALRFYSRFLRQLNDDNSLQITPYLRYINSEFLQHYLPGQPLEENGQRGLGLQLTFLQQASDGLHWRTGFDAEYTDADLTQAQFKAVPWSSLFPVGKHYDYQVESVAAGVFINADWQATATTLFNAGLRYSSIWYDYENHMLDGSTAEDGSRCGDEPCRYSRPADRKDRFGNWSFDAGLTQDVGDHLALIGTIKHGFRPPQATELYRLQSGQQVADIEPELLNSLEAGLRGDYRLNYNHNDSHNYSHISYSLVGFLMEKDNVIFADSLRRNVSDGKTRHYGLEYSLDWQLLEHWALAVDGTYARHLYANNASPRGVGPGVDIEGNDIDTAPRHMGSLRLLWDYHGKGRAELEWAHLGAYYLDPSNLHQYQGYNLINLRTRYQMTPRLGASFRITNLGNAKYAERADYAFGEYRYFIGQPRSLFAGISFSF
jgi:outer membrane receptor protein involved in Fe transport